MEDDNLSSLGNNLEKQLLKYQRRRKDQVILPFQGDVTDYIHAQEAAAMVPASKPGQTVNRIWFRLTWMGAVSISVSTNVATQGINS